MSPVEQYPGQWAREIMGLPAPSGVWRPGDVARDANNDLWWRHWDNGGWSFLMRFPGNWVMRSDVQPTDIPIPPLALVLRNLEPVH